MGEPDAGRRLSERLTRWRSDGGDTTLGGLVSRFDRESFALVFVLLLGVSALPLPTGGATHVFDVIAVLVAGQVVIGRDHVWIPSRWRGLQLAGGGRRRFLGVLTTGIRLCERFSRPRLRGLIGSRPGQAVFGLSVIALTAGAFLAPPFSGLDTLPALGVVLLSLGVLLEDALLAALGAAVGTGGVVLEVVVGRAAVGTLTGLLG